MGHYSDNKYYDDAYYIVEYGADECTQTDKAGLSARLGDYYNDSYIFWCDYDEYGIIRDMNPPMP